MMQHRLGPYTSAAMITMALLTGAGGGGCSGSVAPGGPGAGDGGSDAMGGNDATGGGDATGGCTPADCAGLPAPALAKVCPDGTSLGATLCTQLASGQCAWGFPACPGDAGSTCPGLGCFPQCPNGVLKDANGCDTCQCAPAADAGGGTDAGGACVSQRGGPCGGNTAHPCTCATGLVCTPGDSGLPFGDVGGTCQ